MHHVSILGFLVIAIFMDSTSSSSVYNMKCGNSSECAIYPNITQGPEWIWIPFFCNEENVCACPNGWTPLIHSEVCVTKVSGSIEVPCTAYIWAISFLTACLLAMIIYNCKSLFSKSIKNQKNLPPTETSETKV